MMTISSFLKFNKELFLLLLLFTLSTFLLPITNYVIVLCAVILDDLVVG